MFARQLFGPQSNIDVHLRLNATPFYGNANSYNEEMKSLKKILAKTRRERWRGYYEMHSLLQIQQRVQKFGQVD